MSPTVQKVITSAKHARTVVPSLFTATQGYAAKWQGSEKIREEFKSFEAYAATMTAKAKGLRK